MTEQTAEQKPLVEISVGAFIVDERLAVKLERVAGEGGLGRPIRHPRVQKSGLALAGHYFGVVPTRVQVLGETELSFLDALSNEARSQAARGFFSLGLSCVVLTRAGQPARALASAAEATSTPLFISEARTSQTINAIHAVLDDRLAPQTQLHGVLVDVFGVGLLLLGKSGIGKSECAIELVLRGHRFVADDVVKCDWRPPGMVFGSAADLLRHHIEVRGLGVLNIKDMFGVTSVRERKRIDVVVRLVEWNDKDEYDRLGVEDKFYSILDTPVRMLTVPVRPGRDMGSIVEMAARNELLRRAGSHTAKEFLGRLEETLITAGAPSALEDQPESLCGAPVALKELESVAPPNSSAARPGGTLPWAERGASGREQANESSAWIPAARPRKE